jgi:hypothetical protein
MNETDAKMSGSPELAAGAAERGSEILMQRMGRRRLSEDQLKRIITLVEQDDELRLIDILDIGIPWPDILYGTFRTTPKRLGTTLERMLDLEDVRVRGLEVFPYGVPVIDEIVVKAEFVSGPAR